MRVSEVNAAITEIARGGKGRQQFLELELSKKHIFNHFLTHGNYKKGQIKRGQIKKRQVKRALNEKGQMKKKLQTSYLHSFSHVWPFLNFIHGPRQ